MKTNNETPFTVEQIKAAHSKVKSGADFPAYIQELIKLGVTGYQTFVTDSHTLYKGANGYETASAARYEPLIIADASNKSVFVDQLKNHQRGGSDYYTFCRQCAEAGIEKWVVDMAAMTCVYYDKAGNEILSEAIPQ
ncbi:DUF1398 family protein [Mucilaginibacter mali]|uniref:DUF1398 family protein n=1 Tax=Mucilaginibacter mali TaxID=2740462 RepID=A0A7D4UFF1_9SPHI|nr:DUF1398 family protein [Mucilaginibacter mali]QKJ32679.1 DUF1398 family protein [Mucilaginibacter mali]